MSKPEYINRFSVQLDRDTKEAVITFSVSVTTLDDQFQPAGIEHIEVAKVIMTDYNLKELNDVITTIFEKSENEQK